MNLSELLSEFKKIHPDPAYTETSRRAILATMPLEARNFGARGIFLRVMETGIAVALTGFFIFLLVGGFSGSTGPAQYAAIDPKGLRAEAQAIDIQIQLANVTYNEAVVASAESTAPTVGAKKSAATLAAPLAAPKAASGDQGTSSSSPTSTNVTIDQALESLSN